LDELTIKKYDNKNNNMIEMVMPASGRNKGCLCLKGGFIPGYWFTKKTNAKIKLISVLGGF